MFPCSTSTHLFVSQQVEAHYRKLHAAKSCIDNKTPHSLFTNPKAKCQRLPKRYLRPGAVDPRIENLKRPISSTFHFEDPVVDEIVAGLLKSYKRRDFSSLHSQQNVRKNSNHLQTSSARSSSLNSLYKSRLPLRDPPADVLELHRDSFTEVKAHCPRTLKSAASSKLRTLDCYNPPKRRQLPDGLHVRNPSTKSQDTSLQASDKPKKNVNSSRIPSELDMTPSGPSAPWLPADAQPRGDTLRPPPLILEEIEYLNFLSAVTGEVIQKRQFSNNQLALVFRKHLEHSPSKLTKDQRLKAIRQIGQQLNLPPGVIAASTNCEHQPEPGGEAGASDPVGIGGTRERGESTGGGGSPLHEPSREVGSEQSGQPGQGPNGSREKDVMTNQIHAETVSSPSISAKSSPQPSEMLFHHRDEVNVTSQPINPASTITLESHDTDESLEVLEVEDVSVDTDDGCSYSENHYTNESFTEEDDEEDD